MLPDVIEYFVNVKPVGCVQRNGVIVFVFVFVELCQRNRLGLQFPEVGGLREDDVGGDTYEQQVHDQDSRTFEWRAEVNFFATKSSQLHVVISKEAEAVPEHQR